MNQVKSEAPTFGENVGAFGKLTITWAGGRMAVWFSAKIITASRALVNPRLNNFAIHCIGGRP